MILYLARGMRRPEEIRQAFEAALETPGRRMTVLLRDLSGGETMLSSSVPLVWVEGDELPAGGAARTRLEVTFLSQTGANESDEDCPTAVQRAVALARGVGVVFLLASDQHPLAARRVSADGTVVRDLLDDYGLDEEPPRPVVCASDAKAPWEPEWIGTISSSTPVLDVEGLHQDVAQALGAKPSALELCPFRDAADPAAVVSYALRHPWGRAWHPDDDDSHYLLQGVTRYCQRSASELRVTHFSGGFSKAAGGSQSQRRTYVVSNRGVEVEYLRCD